MKSLLKVVEKYDGSSDISVWLDQLKTLMRVQKVKEDLHELVPLFLKGDAFELYSQLDEDTIADSKLLEKELRKHFGIDSFEAFDYLRNLKWQNGDSVSVYLAKIRRLATVCDITCESFILHSFITGLPDHVARQLRTQATINSLSLNDLVSKAKVILKNTNEDVVAMSMRVQNENGKPKCVKCGRYGHIGRYCYGKRFDESQGKRNEINCFLCGGRGHFRAQCPSNFRAKKCFKCGSSDHLSVYCNVHLTENDEGKSSAPVASQQE